MCWQFLRTQLIVETCHFEHKPKVYIITTCEGGCTTHYMCFHAFPVEYATCIIIYYSIITMCEGGHSCTAAYCCMLFHFLLVIQTVLDIIQLHIVALLYMIDVLYHVHVASIL